MLALRKALSLGSKDGLWTPCSEPSLEAWYRIDTNIQLGTGSNVRVWGDSSPNGNDMSQSTSGNQPTIADGVLTFDPDGPDFLSLTGDDITLSDAFTIGVRLNIAAAGGVIVGDNTEDGELIKVFSTTKISVRIDNQTRVDLQLNSGSLIGSEAYMILAREATSGVISLWWQGTKQTDTETMTGTANIDSIGVRKEDLNPFDGTIREIQIYSSTSDALITNVNNRLSIL